MLAYKIFNMWSNSYKNYFKKKEMVFISFCYWSLKIDFFINITLRYNYD